MDLHHLTQEEAGHVEVVDGHVAEQAAGGGDVGGRRGRRVPAGDDELLQAADLPAGHPLAHLGEGRVEPAVEADHDGRVQALDVLPARVDPGQVEVDRLLAEHRLARPYRGGEQVDVGSRGGGDDDGVDACVTEERPRVL